MCAGCFIPAVFYTKYPNNQWHLTSLQAIYRDIARTYPEHDMFKKKDGAGQESLFNVMKAYSIHDREVGYCQGSAFIVGLLLMEVSGRTSELVIFPNTSPSSMNNIRYTAYNNPNIILLSCEKKNISLCSSNTIHLGSKYQYRIGETREGEWARYCNKSNTFSPQNEINYFFVTL